MIVSCGCCGNSISCPAKRTFHSICKCKANKGIHPNIKFIQNADKKVKELNKIYDKIVNFDKEFNKIKTEVTVPLLKEQVKNLAVVLKESIKNCKKQMYHNFLEFNRKAKTIISGVEDKNKKEFEKQVAKILSAVGVQYDLLQRQLVADLF